MPEGETILILACGTCLKLCHSESSELCPLSTMEDLYRIVGARPGCDVLRREIERRLVLC